MKLRQGGVFAAATVLIAFLGGCAVNTEEAPDPVGETSPDLLQRFEQLLPALAEQAGSGLRIEDLREESCLRPEIEEQQLETRWLGIASGEVPDGGTANAALDRIGQWLDAEGWELQDEVTYPPDELGDIRVLMYSLDDVNLTATYRNSGRPWVEVLAVSPCRENPPEHQMQRSTLDPEYGLSSQYYQDGES
ncbi:hypothetical protein [Arthrobacter koreensis]|uniref:hypothetical protein n=1 Tax=Arthrobacter koreensis TaxID=199136 RepID=UPI002DB64B73|nr:hypothetical protein [Arthrobacter koreensis]MEB7449336.1 hypothetical protein [Arthrobacter koreensis]